MGRPRLLGLLVATTLATGAHAGTAAAQTLTLPGVGDVATLGDGCLDVGDLTLGQLAELGADVCVVEDGIVIDVDAYLADQQLPTDPVTDAASGATRSATGAARKAIGSGGGDSSAPTSPSSPSAPSSGSSGGGGGTAAGSGGTAGGDAAADGASAGSPAVVRGGVVDRPSDAERRERARQLANVRALRADLARGVDLSRGVAGPVVPFGGPGSSSDLASPLVADGAAVVPGVDERLAPSFPAGAESEDAVLATSSGPSSDQVPPVLQLLAAAMVLGSGAAWTLVRRELVDAPLTDA